MLAGAAQRVTMATYISKLLGLRPGSLDDLASIQDSKLPGWFSNSTLWQAAELLAPGGSWMDVVNVVMGTKPEDRGLLLSKVLHLLPDQYKRFAIAATSGNAGVDLEAILLTASQDKNLIESVVKTVVNPDYLVRCESCDQPFMTDGTRTCPFCE